MEACCKNTSGEHKLSKSLISCLYLPLHHLLLNRRLQTHSVARPMSMRSWISILQPMCAVCMMLACALWGFGESKTISHTEYTMFLLTMYRLYHTTQGGVRESLDVMRNSVCMGTVYGHCWNPKLQYKLPFHPNLPYATFSSHHTTSIPKPFAYTVRCMMQRITL